MSNYLKFRLFYNIGVFLGRWLPEEKAIFARLWRNEDGLPKGTPLERLTQALPGRSEAQIRTRAHNMLTGKLNLD